MSSYQAQRLNQTGKARCRLNMLQYSAFHVPPITSVLVNTKYDPSLTTTQAPVTLKATLSHKGAGLASNINHVASFA